MITDKELLSLSLISLKISFATMAGTLEIDEMRLILEHLEKRGLVIGPLNAKSSASWALTTKGATYISMLLNTPEPEPAWKDPRDN